MTTEDTPIAETPTPVEPTAEAPAPPALPPDVVVSFSAEVVPNTSEQLIAAMAKCAADGVERLCLFLTTPGGSVMHGLNLYNTLRSMPFELTTHNVGAVNSIGNVVFLAGEHRYAATASTFMFHGVGFDVTNPTRFEEKLLRERLESVRSDQDRIEHVVVDRTHLDNAAARELFLEQQTKDPEWARNNGLIHDIREPEIPAGVPVLPLVFKR